MKRSKFLIFIFSLSIFIYSQSPYTISGFCKDLRSFNPSDNKIIQPLGGESNLTEVQSFPPLKPGEVVLRIRYSATDYRLYKGILANTAFETDVNLSSFELPAGISAEKAAITKFYKEKADNPDQDEQMLYFDNNRIYVRFLSRLFYNDGNSWKTLDNVSLSKNDKKARPLGNIQVLSTPEHAEIFIDGKSTGVFTPNYIQDIFEGQHNLKLQLKNYQNVDTSVEVKAGSITKTSFKMKSALGTLTITSLPSGASVKLNGVKSGTTPVTLNDLEPGVFNVAIEKYLYKSVSNQLNVEMNNDTKWNAVLVSEFGTINIPSVPHQVIVTIDSKQYIGNSSVNLNPGNHLVQFNGAGVYTSVDTSVNILKDQTIRLNINLKRLTGAITVMPLPMDAEVFINNKSYGTGSQVIDSLPTGNYTIVCRKNGYLDSKQNIELKAGENLNVKLLLNEEKRSTEMQPPPERNDNLPKNEISRTEGKDNAGRKNTVYLLNAIKINHDVNIQDEGCKQCNPEVLIMNYLKNKLPDNVLFVSDGKRFDEYFAITITGVDCGHAIGKSRIEVITYKLNMKDEIIEKKEFSRTTVKVKGACSKLDSCAEEIASDIISWVKDDGK